MADDVFLLAAKMRTAAPSSKMAIARQLVGCRGEAVGPLVGLLGDPDNAWYAANALGEIGDRRAIDPLIPFLASADARLAHAAAAALDRIGWKPATDLDQAVFGFAHQNPYLLSLGRAASVPFFLKMLGDCPDEKTAEIVRHLTEILELYAVAIKTESLRALTYLSASWEMTESEPSWVDIGLWRPAVRTIEVDCSHLRALASKELIRRGEITK